MGIILIVILVLVLIGALPPGATVSPGGLIRAAESD